MAQIIIDLDDAAAAAVCAAFGKHLGSADVSPAVLEVTAEQVGAIVSDGGGSHTIVDIAPTSTPRDATLEEVKQWLIELIGRVVRDTHEKDAMDSAKAAASLDAKAMASALNIN